MSPASLSLSLWVPAMQSGPRALGRFSGWGRHCTVCQPGGSSPDRGASSSLDVRRKRTECTRQFSDWPLVTSGSLLRRPRSREKGGRPGLRPPEAPKPLGSGRGRRKALGQRDRSPVMTSGLSETIPRRPAGGQVQPASHALTLRPQTLTFLHFAPCCKPSLRSTLLSEASLSNTVSWQFCKMCS